MVLNYKIIISLKKWEIKNSNIFFIIPFGMFTKKDYKRIFIFMFEKKKSLFLKKEIFLYIDWRTNLKVFLYL